MDLLEGFVGLVAFIAFLACLGKVGDTLSALEKRERGHHGRAITAGQMEYGRGVPYGIKVRRRRV